MGIEVVELTLTRSNVKQPWGFRIVGGVEACLVLKIEKILGVYTPASKAGLHERDVIIEVNSKSVVYMTHKEFVDMVRQEGGTTMTMKVERGEIVVPNMQECFPLKSDQDLEKMTEDEKLKYYQEAMRLGLGSRLGPNSFTTVGKFKVKVPKYNCPKDLYSDNTMDEMISGSSAIDTEKLDPTSPCYSKLTNVKKFDPARSAVLSVMNDHDKGRFEVDVHNIHEIQPDTVRKI
eukprot:TRINITY_DN25665_c0_g1_i10.p1 TRINITY_DN25665_c0_g1~~TRINITY_DN25665_c0_g1_i10.p1  ORF type:complete len:233 (+),score=64.01 TRINITY_DN25665_c0_g1_i10:101-799(+)